MADPNNHNQSPQDIGKNPLRSDEVKDVYDTLCSLMTAAPDASAAPANPDSRPQCSSPASSTDQAFFESRSDCFKSCPKQLQLPMFLSKTYHMIDRCDDDIAGWSEQGDSFVVKNVDQFAASVLPLYFKHSNFSSFARQLNFYGFRKLRSEGILTAAADPQSANFVRFYHQNFQRDKPELLSEIRRATKTDQQSKDDLEALKQEVKTLKHALAVTATEYDRRLAELSYDFNRRLNATNVQYEKLAALLRQLLPSHLQGDAALAAAPAYPNPATSDLTVAVVAAAANSILNSSESPPTQRSQANLLHSLSQVAAAHALQQQQQANGHIGVAYEDAKRPADSNGDEHLSKLPRLPDAGD
ncbi:hypothetical protein MPSEU_001017100 [Mayamaea pseudoterrestris]|nr:hypothetical protein MPSEU_001017100 [Mayamaea pseudoterrestris]